MTKSSIQTEENFNTEHKYAIVSGWLILPAIFTLFTFLGSLIMLFFVNPMALSGFDVYIYLMDIILLPLLIVIYYVWWKQKHVLPKLMIVFFAIYALWEIFYYIGGVSINFFNIAVSIVWVIYFIKSK